MKKRFNYEKYKAFYDAFDKLKSPFKKDIIIRLNSGEYLNTMTLKKSRELKKVLSKKQFDEKDYILEVGYSNTCERYALDKLENIDALCIRQFSFDNFYNKDGWTLKSAKIYSKINIPLMLPELQISGKKAFAGNILMPDYAVISYDEWTEYLSEIREFFKKDNLHVHTWDMDYFDTFKYKQSFNQKVGTNDETADDFLNEFVTFYGKRQIIASGRFMEIEDFLSLRRFTNYKQPKGLDEKALKKNKYLNLTLPKITYDKSTPDLTGYCQKIDENVAVLRICNKNTSKKQMEDMALIFVEKGKSEGYRKNLLGKWVKLNLSCVTNWNFKVKGLEDKSLDGTLFRFTGDIAKEFSDKSFAKALALIVGNPILEQLYKSEGKDMILEIIKNNPDKQVKNLLDYYFGKIDYSKKSLYAKLGLNKYQFQKIAKNFKYKSPEESSLRNLKQYFRESISLIQIPEYYKPIDFVDISSIDNNTFDIIYDFNNLEMNENWEYSQSDLQKAVAIVGNLYSYNAMCKVANMLTETYKKHKKISFERTLNFCDFYYDYIDMIVKLKDFDEHLIRRFTPYYDPKNYFDSVRAMHDLAEELYETKSLDINEKAFERAAKKVDKYVFKDDDFLAIRPQKAEELIEEGIKLHHCVKTYISRVTDGNTNIMFIRQSGKENIPYYTVEVSNKGTIEQIHGLCNCNVEKGSNLESFVKKWAKEKHLKLNGYDKVR